MSAASIVLPPSATTDLPLDGPVEHTIVATPTVDYEPFLADKKYHKTSLPTFLTSTEGQGAVYQEVFNYFVAEDYAILGPKDGDGKLTEEERSCLVSSAF